MSITHDPPQWARSARPANVAATGSAAPREYVVIPESETDEVYTHRSHAAQYGAGRRDDFTVRGLVMHTTETDDDRPETDDFNSSMIRFMYLPETVSATALSGEDGQLGLLVPGDNRPWTTGRWNDETETLEIVGRAAWSVEKWRTRPAQIEGITRWIVARCRALNIPAVWLDADAWAEGASYQSVRPFTMGTRRGITDHLNANQAAIKLGGSPTKYSHHDVGDGLRWLLINEIIPEASRRLASSPEEVDVAGMRVVKIRFNGFAEQLVCFRASADTLRTSEIIDDPVIVLDDPTPEQQALIEAELGRPLSRMGVFR